MSRWNKIFSAILAFALLANLAACAPSSADSSGDSSGQGHVHNYKTEWTKDASGHWHACTGCGEKKDFAEHSGGNASCGEKNKCAVCDREYGSIVGHSYGEYTQTQNGGGYVCGTCGDTQLLTDVVDFVVEVEEGRAPVILQLTDPQITYADDQRESRCYAYIRETVEATNPDLILVTGDLIYGKYDADGTVFSDYVSFMESFEIPWAPVFGNHDNESVMGVDWQCQQLENAEYCLFEQKDLTGNGNYSVGVLQGDKLLRAFYMLDSNGCGAPSSESSNGKNGIKTSPGFSTIQITWYTQSMAKLKELSPNTQISMAYHIQSTSFKLAFEQYEEFDETLLDGQNAYANPLHFDVLETAKEGDIGYLGRPLKTAWSIATSLSMHETLKSLGVDSIFVGHEHCNSASVVFDGIRYQYGQKSSTYDRFNSLKEDGTIVGSSKVEGTPLIGGTVFSISQEDGSIQNPYIYYCGGNPFGA